MRLTEKNGNGDFILNRMLCNPKENVLAIAKEVTDKLGQLEDLEDELGFNLVSFVKVMKNGVIFVKGKEPEWAGEGKKKDIVRYCVERFDKDRLKVRFNNYCDSHFIYNPLKSYGKTWALTKEELE